MSVKEKNFIIVSLSDKDSYGFDEHALPKLIQLVDSTAPDSREFFHTGVVAYYLTSRRTLTSVERLVKEAEALRLTDPKLSSLGIGISEGSMIAEFDWLGRVKSMPLGVTANLAARGVHEPEQYVTSLRELGAKIS